MFLGIALVIIAWCLSWIGPTSLGAHTFFPLWLGYILVVDGLVSARSGTSLWTRNPLAFVTLFVVSAPLWWLFEAANVRLQNWHYHLPHDYGWLHYRTESSLAFSTVLPAVFGTTELLHTTRFGKRAGNWRRFSLSSGRRSGIMAIGALMIALSMLLPRFFFPLVWIGGFLLIDPINARRGRGSLLRSASEGHWRPIVILAAAGPICGFFWEMWNIRAMPKWTYDIPYFEWLHLFEMPILGYGGYIPFAFELYAAYHLFTAVLPERAIAHLSIDERGTDSRERTQS